jgi:hypothetical protein
MVLMHRRLVETVRMLYPTGTKLMIEAGLMPKEAGIHAIEVDGRQMRMLVQQLLHAEREGCLAVILMAWMFTASVDSTQSLGPPEEDPDQNPRSN